MAITFGALARPNAGSEVWAPSRHRTVGLWLAAVGLAFATVSLINSAVAGELARVHGVAVPAAPRGDDAGGVGRAAGHRAR
jgi:hypothetical protein